MVTGRSQSVAGMKVQEEDRAMKGARSQRQCRGGGGAGGVAGDPASGEDVTWLSQGQEDRQERQD